MAKLSKKMRNVWFNVACGIQYTLWFVLLMASCVVFNPLTVWVVALIAPRQAAKWSYQYGSSWEHLIEVPFSGYKWIWHILPWRSRKHYIEASEAFFRFSSKDRVRFVVEVKNDRFNSLDEGEKTEVFWKYPNLREYIAENGCMQVCMKELENLRLNGLAESFVQRNELRKDLWSNMLEFPAQYKNIVRTALFQRTPSEEVIMMLAASKVWFDTLIAVLKKYGISKSRLGNLLANLTPGQQAEVRYALIAHRQVSQVRAFARDWEKGEKQFAAYLKSEVDFCGLITEEMQAALSPAEYRIFRKQGFCLTEEAAWNILKGGDYALIEEMFRLEEKHGLYKQEAKELVEVDPKLHNLFFKVKKL